MLFALRLSFSSGSKGPLWDSNRLQEVNAIECENAGKTEVFARFLEGRRGGRAADCIGLGNRRRRKASKGSNPFPSA